MRHNYVSRNSAYLFGLALFSNYVDVNVISPESLLTVITQAFSAAIFRSGPHATVPPRSVGTLLPVKTMLAVGGFDLSSVSPLQFTETPGTSPRMLAG